MTDEMVPLEVADFLLGRLMGEIQINRELNKEVSELKTSIEQINKHWKERLEWTERLWKDAQFLVTEYEYERDKRWEKAELRRQKLAKNKPKVKK